MTHSSFLYSLRPGGGSSNSGVPAPPPPPPSRIQSEIDSLADQLIALRGSELEEEDMLAESSHCDPSDSACRSRWARSCMMFSSILPPPAAPPPPTRRSAASAPPPIPEPTQTGGVEADVVRLVRLQCFDGSFVPTPELGEIIGNTVLGESEKLGVDKTVWATALAVAYLEKYLLGQAEMLEGLLGKAKAFLKQDGESHQELLDAARRKLVCISPTSVVQN